MNRTISYSVEDAEQGLSIKKYLQLRDYSTRSLIAIKQNPEGLSVNGTPVYINHILKPGDTLTVQIRETEISEKIEPVQHPLDIIYEDDDLLVVNKPAGMPIHPSMNNYGNSLANALAYYFTTQNEAFVFRCINRLDKDTSGLTVVAKHHVSAGILSAMVASKSASQFTREYRAIVRGNVTPVSGFVDAPIARKEGSVLEREVNYEKGESAVTHYQLLKNTNGYSLLSLHLETGRTHQIRVHMKYLGFPLIGDHLYNPDMEAISRQALHAYRLAFTHPITREPMEFTAPLPEDMRRALGN